MNRISRQLFKIAMLVLSYRMKLNNSQKSELTKYIEQIRIKKVNQKILGQFFYNLLTKGGLQIEQLKKSFNSFSKQQKQKYSEYINKLFPINNGVWAQINFNKNLSTKTDKTYNYYLNIQFPQKKDVVNYLKSLYQLMKQVKQLSDKHKCYVGFKTHATLTALLNHNDTLKFYFYDNKNELKNDLQQLVNNYINKNHLKRGKRLYDHGLDTQDDLGKKSFGQRLSNQLTKIFIQWIDKNKNKYTNQQFVQSFERDLEIWIKNVAKKLV